MATDEMDALTSRASQWSVECNVEIDELTSQFVGFSIAPPRGFQPAETLEKIRPILSFPEQSQSQATFYPHIQCGYCLKPIGEAFAVGLGWEHEEQCQGCGCSDTGSAWREKQNREEWTVSCCIVQEQHAERTTRWQFLTKWDARQFGVWVQNCDLDLHCEHKDACLLDPHEGKYNYTKQSAFDALRDWHHQQRRVFDPALLQRDLENMDVYEPLCEAVDSYKRTFRDHRRAWAYERTIRDGRLGMGFRNPYEEYDGSGWYIKTIVWLKHEDGWCYIKRQVGESNFSLFCRGMGLNEADYVVNGLPYGKPLPPEYQETLRAFEDATLSTTKEDGKICLHNGWWCWLPQKEEENPDQFEARAKQFETKLATRVKQHPDGTRRTYKQHPQQTLASFIAYVNDRPGVLVDERKRVLMVLDWAS